MMECYVSFSNDIVLGSMALLEGFFGSQTSISRYVPLASTDVSSKDAAAPKGGPLKESTPPQVPHEKWARMEAPPNQFPGWEKVLHPSQVVATVGQAPSACGK